MIAVAIGLNIVFALFGFYVAWRLWRLGQSLSNVADSLVVWERNSHNILNPSRVPPAILRGKTGTTRLRQHYAQLQQQVQRLRQLIAVVSILPFVGRWVRRLGLRGLAHQSSHRSKHQLSQSRHRG
ncbi:MAG: hypothetical protein HC922_00955 [Leptolyngbyaceae cyanobacterium SM2_3_12]|nr:hypothetical protein [Leptolyngbyaceae cyanobacterium SM2_3_12]